MLCEGATLKLDPWQENALRVILAERDDGKWAAREAAFLVARQNGKGGILHAIDLAGLFLFDDVKEILHSAHEHKTARKSFRELRDYIKGAPHLYAQVERRGNRVVGFRQSNEETSITLQNGKVLRFIARSNSSGRGFSPQMVVMDEAQICSFDTRQALQYTVRAQPNPLIVWCGTVPTPKDNGEVFLSLRKRGLAGDDRSLAWLEWSPPDDCDPKSDDAIEWSNPGMGYRISYETVELERAAALLNDEEWDGFCREALSIWPDEDGDVPKWQVITETDWAAGLRPLPDAAPQGATLCIEIAQDRTAAAIISARSHPDGIAIEVDHRPGTDWLMPRLIEVRSKVAAKAIVVDPKAQASTEIRQLADAHGIEVREVTTAEVMRAAGEYVTGTRNRDVIHFGDDALTASTAAVESRKNGESWLFNRWGPGDPYLTIGASLARWGHREIEAPPETSVYEERGLIEL